CRWLNGEIEGLITLTHYPLKLLLYNLYEHLARGKAALDFLAYSPLTDTFNKVLHYRQGDVRLQQCHTHFAESVLNIVIGEPRLTGNLAQAAGKSVLEVLKHVALPYPG
ncbi:MAG: hypothetical protein ACI92N_002514, partial [Pseudomonadales bacterium]